MQTQAEASVSRRPRRGLIDIAAVLFATASVGVTLSTILRANRLWLVRYIPDDAFYYLEVGQRIGRGGERRSTGSTVRTDPIPCASWSSAAWGRSFTLTH